mgnify:CR=1 FL=1
MKPIKRLPKINPKTTKELEETTNKQSKNRSDHEYLKMIRRVLDEVFPDR